MKIVEFSSCRFSQDEVRGLRSALHRHVSWFVVTALGCQLKEKKGDAAEWHQLKKQRQCFQWVASPNYRAILTWRDNETLGFSQFAMKEFAETLERSMTQV